MEELAVPLRPAGIPVPAVEGEGEDPGGPNQAPYWLLLVLLVRDMGLGGTAMEP